MALTVTATRPRANIIETYLAGLTNEERDNALDFLTNPNMYAHVDVADALSVEIGHDISETTVRRWRRKHA